MHRSVHIAYVLGCACLMFVVVASTLAAQGAVASDQTADVLGRMRADLSARRYAAVIANANGLLESARAITTPQRIELFQLLAAAYYPNVPSAQKADSARLPLAALIRLAPDITISREFSWSGLDDLTDRTRAEFFAVVTRPSAEYALSSPSGAIGRLAVVASRPTRFQLTSVSDATGRTVVHDNSAYVMNAALRLRTHDERGPIFTDGTHQLVVWAHDLSSGDSVRIAHRVRAVRSDLPPPVPSVDSVVATRAAISEEPTTQPATPSATRHIVPTYRSPMLWGGLALAAATAVIAQEARPDDGIQAAFRVDARAFVVGAVMATAAVVNFFTSRAPTQPAPLAVRTTTVRQTPSPPPPPVDVYRVHLQIDPLER